MLRCKLACVKSVSMKNRANLSGVQYTSAVYIGSQRDLMAFTERYAKVAANFDATFDFSYKLHHCASTKCVVVLSNRAF